MRALESFRSASRHPLGGGLAALAAAASVAGCIVFRSASVESVPTTPAATRKSVVTSRVKAHLADGSTVLYPDGVQFAGAVVWGRGMRYGLTLADSVPVSEIALDSVLAMETFHTHVRPVETFLVSTLAVAGTVAIGIAVYCATDPKCFGSCPTFYSDSAGTPVLEAEGFSYAIAPLFEARDVDRLRALPDAYGTLRLEVRNEALETHYLNHLKLVEVRHDASEIVLTDPQGRPLVVRDPAPPALAVDRTGRDVLDEVVRHDGITFRTDSATLAGVSESDPWDYLDLQVPVSPGADSVAIVLRLRNSLLATVLFYDLMLGDRGPGALDWLARDLQQIGPATEMGLWAREYLGMQVAVWDGSRYVPIARVADTGPVAWKDLAVPVPVMTPSPLRIRLSFAADNWRIDRVAAAPAWRRPESRTVALAAVIDAAGHPDSAAATNLAEPDTRYLETSAGQRFDALFDVGHAPGAGSRTFLLASQGYYTEWIRQSWLRAEPDTAAFAPGAGSLVEAMRRWRATQQETERLFRATRVPVR